MKSASQEGSQTAFVMMPFRAESDDVYSIVRDSIAAVDESMNVIRLDEVRAAGSITQDLVEMIRKSTLCLADVTGANPNVMWEVGFAAALGKPVIAITRQNGELPFDCYAGDITERLAAQSRHVRMFRPFAPASTGR